MEKQLTKEKIEELLEKAIEETKQTIPFYVALYQIVGKKLLFSGKYQKVVKVLAKRSVPRCVKWSFFHQLFELLEIKEEEQFSELLTLYMLSPDPLNILNLATFLKDYMDEKLIDWSKLEDVGKEIYENVEWEEHNDEIEEWKQLLKKRKFGIKYLDRIVSDEKEAIDFYVNSALKIKFIKNFLLEN